MTKPYEALAILCLAREAAEHGRNNADELFESVAGRDIDAAIKIIAFGDRARVEEHLRSVDANLERAFERDPARERSEYDRVNLLIRVCLAAWLDEETPTIGPWIEQKYAWAVLSFRFYGNQIAAMVQHDDERVEYRWIVWAPDSYKAFDHGYADTRENAMMHADKTLSKGPPAKTPREPSKCRGMSCGGLGGYHRPGCEGRDA